MDTCIARFKCGKWEFRFRQNADVVCGRTEDFRGTFCATTTVEVDDIQPNNLEEALAVLDAICWLLSFATESHVICYGHHFPDKMHGHFKSTTGIANPFRPPFDLIDTVKIKSFAAGIAYVKGYYRRPSSKLGKAGERFNFEDLLSEMLLSVGMRRGLKQIVSLRNEIIHSGLSRKSHLRLIDMYERIQDILREYVLRLLGYHGEFILYASGGYAVRKI